MPKKTPAPPASFEEWLAVGGPPPPLYVDKHAVAQLFGVSPRSVEDWAVDGTLPPDKKIGARLNRWWLPSLVSTKEVAS